LQSTAVAVNGSLVPHCQLTPQNRPELARDGAVVLIPRDPLPGGAMVTTSLRDGGGRMTWAFRVR
nr:hypothetical protein [Acidimicrobiia bacterium]